ncbi:MAG: hypothetical protein RL103_1707 [Pseudomonadota bacterium]|jgi:hypothetical protein
MRKGFGGFKHCAHVIECKTFMEVSALKMSNDYFSFCQNR